jgi:hypothetical protein
VGEQIVADWAQDNPGTRPLAWWRFDAPEPRKRLGGIGTAEHEVLATALWLIRGIPASWLGAWMAENCRQASARRGEVFEGVPIDPKFPPLYESEAAYLKRLDLLLPGEEKRLDLADFEPEAVNVAEISAE